MGGSYFMGPCSTPRSKATFESMYTINKTDVLGKGRFSVVYRWAPSGSPTIASRGLTLFFLPPFFLLALFRNPFTRDESLQERLQRGAGSVRFASLPEFGPPRVVYVCKRVCVACFFRVGVGGRPHVGKPCNWVSKRPRLSAYYFWAVGAHALPAAFPVQRKRSAPQR